MLNIKGYSFPSNKNIHVSLTYIYGIGFFISKYICRSLNINIYKKNFLLNDFDLKNIICKLSLFKTGDTLKRNVFLNIQKLKDIKCYRGIRHMKNLPVRGQNTKNNARTRKGSKKSILFKSKNNVIKKKHKKKK